MNKFAVFDIDGTLIRWQLYHAVVDKLAKQGKLGPNAHKTIQTARMRWKNRESDYGFHEYESEIITHFEQALETLSPEIFNHAVEDVIEEHKRQVYVFTRNLLSRLKKEGYILIAISGSQQQLVEKIATFYGFNICLGTNYATDSGKFTGEKVFPAHNKKMALQKIIKDNQLEVAGSYAIGDSKSDSVMLEMVENPIAFNPDVQLYEISIKNRWPIVIERKNVIYRLEYKDGSYLLAETI